MSWEDADATCGFSCTLDSDCDRDFGEMCWGNVKMPQGCTARFMGTFLMIAYVLVPVFFALLDAPVTGELRSVALMLKSGPAYILFMPTFVAFFSAYSLNRLADVSWGNRPGGEASLAETEMKKWAKCIACIVPLLNLAFAMAMCGLRLVRPDLVQVVAWWVMGVAGYTFGIALLASTSKLCAKLISCFGCGGNSEEGGLKRGGNPNMFMMEAVHELRATMMEGGDAAAAGSTLQEPLHGTQRV